MTREGSFQANMREVVSDAPLRGARAERAVHELLRRTAQTPPGGAPWTTRSLRTGQHLMAFACKGESGAEMVARIAWSRIGAETLESHRRSLDALEEIAALEQWRYLVPRILEKGVVRGRDYTLETLMPGVDGRRLRGAAHSAAQRAITRAIAPLYSATTQGPGPDFVPAVDLIRDPLALLRRACGDSTGVPLARLSDRLESALADHQLSFCRVHGDLWLGNAILSANGSTVTGLIDWASSRATGLPAVDLAHLLVTSRAIATQRDIGVVVKRLLDGSDRLDRAERQVLAEQGAAAGELLETDDLMLLAWLQHVGHVLGGSKLWIPRLWLNRNVSPVLVSL